MRGHSADLPYDRIIRIDRPNDGLGNGALIGLGVGAAFALTAIAIEDQRDCEGFGCVEPTAGGYVTGPLVLGGLGAAAGVAIDALIRRDRGIYLRGRGAQATVIPTFAVGVRGAAVSVTW